MVVVAGVELFKPFDLATSEYFLEKKNPIFELSVKQVDYEVKNFCRRNKDEPSNDMISMMQSSEK